MTGTPREEGPLRFFLAALMLSSIGCSEVRYRDSISGGPGIERIVIRGDVGLIQLVPSAVARIDLAIRAPEGAAFVQLKEVEGLLEVSSRCRTPVLCAVDAEVHVPPNAKVEVELDRGEVWATGIGSVDISVGEGEVDVDALADVTVQIGRGAARIVAREGQQIRVAVGLGDIDVTVPSTRWNLDIIGSEETVRGIQRDGNSQGRLELVAPAGRVKVRGVEPTARDSGLH